MTSLAIALALTAVTSLKEFFPAVPGTKLTYTETGPNKETVVTTDEIGAPTIILGQPTVPVMTYQGTRKTSSAYYRVEDEAIYLVASSPTEPFKTPLPLVRYAAGTGNWDFETDYGKGEGKETMIVHGSARMIGTRMILDRKVEVLQVILEAKTGGGKFAVEDKQTFLYGRGIGMIEFVSVSKFGKDKLQRTLKLTKFEMPKGS